MKTQQLYLSDSYLQEMDATIVEVFPEGDPSAGSGQGKRWRLILDNTVFYPMGGGQPTDQGTLTGEKWTAKVYMVMNKDGEIGHYVESDVMPTVGMNVHGKIDWNRRFLNMKNHSAGHVVDFAMFLLGYSPKTLMPTKGDHGKKSFIMYTGVLGKEIIKELEDKSNELIAKALPLASSIVPLENLQKDAIYLQPGLPTNKPLRKLTLEGVGSVADGGTQVKNTSEVGHITISSIIEENGNTIVYYRVS
jgi:Ser-tRNA(Ala) deacylase AlaX